MHKRILLHASEKAEFEYYLNDREDGVYQTSKLFADDEISIQKVIGRYAYCTIVKRKNVN